MIKKGREKIKVSVIIPAYNEEKCIRQTVGDLLKCRAAKEIIVVNDGSTDRTKKILKKFGKKIRLISYRKNKGKGYAIYRGIRAARGKAVVFLDAHLKGLKDSHIKALAQPIIKRKANYVLGYRVPPKPTAQLIGSLTGERAYLRRILLPHLSRIKKTHFGVEVYLNEVFNPKWGKKIHLTNLVHLLKHQKMSRNEVLPAYIKYIIEFSRVKAELKIGQYRQLQKILDPRKIKSFKTLQRKVDEIKDKEVSELIKDYILPYLKKISQ